MPASITASDALAFGFQEGPCSRADLEGGSVATGGDGAVQLMSYKATSAAAPGEEDLPAGGVSTISHPCPVLPSPSRSLRGRGRAPGAWRRGGGVSALISTAAVGGPAWRNKGKHRFHPKWAKAR